MDEIKTNNLKNEVQFKNEPRKKSIEELNEIQLKEQKGIKKKTNLLFN